MLNTIYKALEQLGLNTQKRALHIQFSNTALNSQVFLQGMQGQHELNQGLAAQLFCLSTNASLSLKQFIGCQVAIDQVTDMGQLFRTTGIITSASQGQSDGALTVYQLTLQDATSLWHKRRNSRVFMNKSVTEITDVIFKEWQSKSSLFAASLSLDSSGLTQDYDIRPFVMQSNETDYAFLTRLWRSEGINWLVDESQLLFAQVSDEIQPQKLRLIDDNSAFTALSRQNIRFHRSSATELLDSMTSLVAHRDLQSTAVHIQRWQADQLSQDDASGSNLSAHTHSEQQGNEELSLEQAWSISPAWISDLNGEDQSTASSASQIDKLNQQLSAYQELQAKYFKAQTTVRDAQVGYWFELTGHPEIDLHTGSDREFLIYSKQFYQQNNLPKDLQAQVDALFKQSHWSLQERQGNHLTLVRRQIRMLPDYDPLQYRPNAYPQHARVAGPSGETLHVDQWGRIKVRFLFTRSDDHSHDGGAGSNDNDTDSAWVDVLTPWAGEGYGARFLPRVGELVVIDFFDGNVDRPFVLGRIHEAERHPTRFDVKGQLPDTKKLSGIRSQEVDGSGFNQLRFDDTTGQISVQLQSSHGASQLNLGNLSHPKEQATSDGRGEGFELRTDQWGAMRAGKGLLISTYAQDQAVADHLAAAEAQSLLKQGQDSMQMLSQVAVKQQTDALNVLSRLPKFIESLEIKSTQQALTRTVDLFKNGLSNDPLSTLKNCGSFVQEMGAFGSSTQNIVEQFKSQFTDSKEAISNLKQTIENLEEQGTEVLKGKLASLKAKVNDQPLQVLGDLGSIIEQVKIDPEKYMTCGSFEKLNEFTPNKALQQIQGFMEGYTQGLETSNSQAKQEQGKLFRQALMLLASPNGIALTTPEDILLQASQDIAQGSQANINLSAQKNIVAHAQSKISLFAAEQGLKAFAGKGKLELQAQDDAIEVIARKVIKLISTEDKIEIISPKEISLNAGGSQLKINADGVFATTGGKFESKAGQHVFTGGAKVSYEVPTLPNTPLFSNRLDVYDLFWESDFSQLSYKAYFPESNAFTSGQIDEHGRTGKITTADASKVKVLIGSNDDWGLSIDGFDEEDFDDGQDTEESVTDSNNLEEETENNE